MKDAGGHRGSVPVVLILVTLSWGALLIGHESVLPDPVPSDLATSSGYFIENVGQLANPDVRYYVPGDGVSVAFANGAVLIRVSGPTAPPTPPKVSNGGAPTLPSRITLVRLTFEGANPVAPEGRGELPFRSNFFLGSAPARWRSGVHSYRELVYQALYDGVDLVYRITSHGLKYEFLLRDSSDLGRIRLSYEGIDGLSVQFNGALRIQTASGELRDAPPDAEWSGRSTPCSFTIVSTSTVGLHCPAVPNHGPILIDPLLYATYLGGNGTDSASALRVDTVGNAYVTGVTRSADFPANPGAYDTNLSGLYDAFVAKLSPAGDALLYATFLGGSQVDYGIGLAIDAFGNAYVTGATYSSDFPTTLGAINRTFGGNDDVFVTKLGPSGATLLYSTYLGGWNLDEGYAIVADGSGRAIVAGKTWSPTFPTTAGAYDRTYNDDTTFNAYSGDSFVARLSAAGTALEYSTLIGGKDWDSAVALAVDPAGRAFVTGDTSSTDYPTTAGAFRTNATWVSGHYSVVTVLSATGSSLVYSTLLGGCSGTNTGGRGIAVDAFGYAYVTGGTNGADFPTTPGAFDTLSNGEDAFVVKLTASGDALAWGTYLGGSSYEWALSLVLDGAGTAYVVGFTDSSDFPIVPGALDATWDGRDAFVTALAAEGRTLLYSTFLGGSGADYGFDGVLGPGGTVYVAGQTGSSDFPATPGAFDVTANGDDDGFVAKLSLALPSTVDLTFLPGEVTAAPPTVNFGDSVFLSGRLWNLGPSDATPVDVDFFRDQDGDGFPDAPEVFSWMRIPRLAGNSSMDVGAPWTALAMGAQTLCAYADPANAIPEQNETNNGGCATVWVRGPPDYLPENPEPSSPINSGASMPVTFSVEVRNAGFDTPAAMATLAFFNESSPTSPFASFPLSPLPPGGTAGPFSANWTAPSALGVYVVIARVDYANDVPEGNEANNDAAWTVDVVPGPVTTLVVGQPNATAGATYVTSATPLSLSVLDQSGTGIRATRYRIDNVSWTGYAAPFTLSPEGERFVEWSSEDNAGNVEAMRSAVLRVDDTPPTTSLVVGNPKHVAAETFVTSATPLALQAIDGGPLPVGVAGVEYRVDGAAAWTPYGVPFFLTGEGAHFVEYRSADLLGNAEPVGFATIVVDDTPPAVGADVGAPRYDGADTYVTSATPFTLTAADGGAVPVGLASLEYRVGGAWTAYGAPFVLAGPDGARTVEYRAADLLGNAFASRLDVVLDDTPPTTTPSHADGTYPVGTTFAFTATDAGSGVARTEVRVDGGAWTTFSTPLELPEGAHVIRFRSVDRLNNTEAERVLTISISGEPPPPSVIRNPNWKPVVAFVFASTLALVGAWSARRYPWPTGSRRRLLAFTLMALPFVALEAATGVVSLLTGWLSIPPILGVGAVVDVGILVAGVAVSANRVRKRTPPR